MNSLSLQNTHTPDRLNFPIAKNWSTHRHSISETSVPTLFSLSQSSAVTRTLSPISTRGTGAAQDESVEAGMGDPAVAVTNSGVGVTVGMEFIVLDMGVTDAAGRVVTLIGWLQAESG